MEMVLKYTDKVKEHFKNPRNAGEMDDATVKATEGSMACGDMMTLYIKIEGNVIVDCKFESYGCAANIATGSVLTELAIGKTVEEAEKIEWDDIVNALDGLPQIKYHCSTLSIDTFRAALNKWKDARSEEGEQDSGELRHTHESSHDPNMDCGLRKEADLE